MLFYCFGGYVLTSFLLQLTTGLALTIYYRPSVLEAFASLKYIYTTAYLGWLVRSLH